LLLCCSKKNNDDSKVQERVNSSLDTGSLALSAHLYYEKEMYIEAFNEYSLLKKHDSLNGEYYYRCGYCLVQLNRHEESIGDFIKAAKLGYNPCKAY
jgi:tetratricopeptide (TPR) repeat protein